MKTMVYFEGSIEFVMQCASHVVDVQMCNGSANNCWTIAHLNAYSMVVSNAHMAAAHAQPRATHGNTAVQSSVR